MTSTPVPARAPPLGGNVQLYLELRHGGAAAVSAENRVLLHAQRSALPWLHRRWRDLPTGLRPLQAASPQPANSSELAGVFCVANSSAGAGELKAGIDWACGVGQANCSAIQPGQPCYDVEDIAAVASFAYNDYYHRMQATGGTFSFGGTAFLTTADPSE